MILMKHRMKRLASIFSASILATAALWAAPQVTVTATIDSVEVMQGRLRVVDVEVVQPVGTRSQWLLVGDENEPLQHAELAPGIEVNSFSAIDTTSLGNGIEQLRRQFLIQPWDSGEYVIPGIALTVGADTFRSKQLALKVMVADVDTMTTIHPMTGTVSIAPHFWDWVPQWIVDYWWALLVGLLIIIGTAVGIYLYKKGGLRKAIRKAPAPVPPYQLAMEQLQVLGQRQLCERGMEKEYYTELTEILRQYLEGRFGINAMEMTTPQIKAAVRATTSAAEASALMNDVLEVADYVKFARLRPLPEDNIRAMRQAVKFVEDTKPVEVAPEAENTEKKEAKS